MSDADLVHPVPLDEAAGWITAAVTTLLGDPYAADFPHRIERWASRLQPDRTWGVRDRNRWVGTLATEARTLCVPAGDGTTTELTADALTAVSVAGTHRRRGLLTQMLTESLQAARDRGDAVAILVAAEWPIYGRYGYAPSAGYADFVYRTRARGATVRPTADGLVRQIEPDELHTHAGAIFDRARRLRPGQIDRPGEWWAQHLNVGVEAVGDRFHWILREGPDGPDGLLGWRVTRRFDIDGSLGALEVTDLVAAGDGAYRDLWAYLSGIDGVEEIRLSHRPVDEPARWLLDNGRALRQTYAGDHLWLALLDVPKALEARGYAAPGRVVLDVVDDSPAGFATGRYRLDAGVDGATCAPTTEAADLQLPARTLAAAYLGGYSVRQLHLAGGLDELRPDAVHRLDTMLAAPLAPWCQTGF